MLTLEFNRYPSVLFYVNWNFFGTSTITNAGAFIDGQFNPVGSSTAYVNFPFWLFFISTVINLAYITKLLNDQKMRIKE
ncbi:MAG: hypothetical protein LBQ98_07625 [Nitrososphaerota archaeon]|jgi:hypothetical protein|nr:hypothetical protein [Nitrososphaerota archaeon]